MENSWHQLKTLLVKIISDSRRPDYINHAENTLKWLLVLDPKASKEAQLAAFAHDMDRCWFAKMAQVENEPYLDYKIRHSQRGADIVSAMMIALEFHPDSVQKVHYLISNHEIGGNTEADTVRDADSLSFFENNLPVYYERRGKEATQTKIRFMYSRASEKAKKLVGTVDFDPELRSLLHETLPSLFV